MPTTIALQEEGISKQLAVFLEGIPCAAYFVKNDEDFTFLYGNACFYTLFDCTKEEICYKYGNRLGALIAPQSLKELCNLLNRYIHQPKVPFALKQQVKKNGAQIWIYTKVCIWQEGETQNLLCLSCDITESELKIKDLHEYKETAALVTEQVKVDAFEYNLDTHVMHFTSTHSLLQQILPSVEREYSNFTETLLQSGAIYADCAEALKTAFASIHHNAPKAVCEIQVKTREAKMRWVRFTLKINSNGERAGRFAIGFLEDITEQKEARLNYLSEAQFYQAMLAEKDGYAQIDVTEDKITRIGGIWKPCSKKIDRKSFSALGAQFAKSMVHPAERKRCFDLLQRANFIESLQNGIDRLGCEFRYINKEDKTMWAELTIHLFKDSVTSHTLALACIKDINAPKCQKANHLQSAEKPEVALKNNQPKSLEEAFADFLSNQSDLAYLVDPDTLTLICANEAFYTRIGRSKEECLGRKCYELVHKRETPCPFCSRANWTSNQFYLWKNYNHVLKQEFLIKNKLVEWHEKKLLLVLSIDISNSKGILTDLLEKDAMESHCMLSGLQGMMAAENLPAAMGCALETVGRFFGAASVRYWECATSGNAYACVYTWTSAKKKEFLTTSELYEVNVWLKSIQWGQPIVLETPEAMLRYSHSMYELMKNHNIQNQRWFPLRNSKKNLGCMVIDNSSAPIQDNTFLEAFVCFVEEEIKKRKLMDEILCVYQRDELTGLLSRNRYEKYLSDYRADSLTEIGVLVADFDRLKEINSSKGFHVGNYCIREFANMLKMVFAQDVVFRLNGDEFLVVIANIERACLDKKVAELEEKVKQDGTFSVSIGYAWDNIEKDLATLIEQATQVMKVNKQLHHDSIPNAVDFDRRKKLGELVAAIENHEFEVFLQPKIEFAHNTMIGAEALIRYRHKTLGYILPIHFIETLENANLIRYVDLFVLEEICKVLERWKQQGLALPLISVNFSRVTLLERNLLSSVEDIVARYDVSKKQIEIEMTESVFSMGKNILCQATNALRNAGFSISLDDFGTKYTNMAILSEIDFDILKLDKSLIASLCDRYSNQIILKNIIHMCRELGIAVIAEGVETKEQEMILRTLGCTQGQGYLYGKPMSIVEFDAKYKRKTK